MSVQHKLKLEISNFNNKVDTIYTKSATLGMQLTVEILNNGASYELPSAENVVILSDSAAYQESVEYPVHATTVNGNKATFNMDGVYKCGWTICSIKITNDDDSVAETQNFQVYCEESPTGDESTFELSVAVRQYLDGLINDIRVELTTEVDEFITDVEDTLQDIDDALTDLIGTTT